MRLDTSRVLLAPIIFQAVKKIEELFFLPKFLFVAIVHV